MNISENTLNILAAKTYRGIGRAWIIKRLRGNESASTIVDMLNRDAKAGREISTKEFEEKRQNIRKQLQSLSGAMDGVLSVGDPSFPAHRGKVKNSEKPVTLFYRGDLRLLEKQNKNVAVIGLLNPDKETEDFEQRVVAGLVSNGATIISGLAFGCDSIAHRQALLSEGKTVAILPSPITEILPKGNKELAEEIVRNDGLLVSEYYKKASSRMELNGRYLERDRLQALFSDCVVLAASYAENDMGNDSGARHAMKYALDYSIPRAVMYDVKFNEGNPKYDLCRQLIREDDRIIVIRGDNVQESLSEIKLMCAGSPRDVSVQKNLFD